MIKGFAITQVLQSSGVTLTSSNVWNDAGTTFTGISFNVTDTASAAASLLLDLRVGGTSRFRVNKSGAVFFTGGSKSAPSLNISGSTITSGIYNAGDYDIRVCYNGKDVARFANTNFRLLDSNENQQIALDSQSARILFGPSEDVVITREAADIFAQRRSTNGQTKRIYGTFTDTSNYRRVVITMTAAGVASIAPEGAGTGASGNVLHISGLPTSNPGAGILWNDAGTVKVGT